MRDEPAARDREPDADTAEVEARLALAKARLGDWPHAANEATIRSQIARSVEQARVLRRVPLANGDEPEIVFVPFRADPAEGA